MARPLPPLPPSYVVGRAGKKSKEDGEMKKVVFLMLAMVMFAFPAFADDSFGASFISIPYAIHHEESGWWSGLAITNSYDKELQVSISALCKGKIIHGHYVTIPKYSIETRLLPDFFPEGVYPTEDNGRVEISIFSKVAYPAPARKFSATLLEIGRAHV